MSEHAFGGPVRAGRTNCRFLSLPCQPNWESRAPGPVRAPDLHPLVIDLSAMSGVPCTWLRTMRDVIVPADEQSGFAANLDDCRVVDIDAGHMCMVGQPSETAAVISRAAQG